MIIGLEKSFLKKDKEREKMSNFVEFGAGAAGGLAGTITGYPFDTVKVRQQCSVR